MCLSQQGAEIVTGEGEIRTDRQGSAVRGLGFLRMTERALGGAHDLPGVCIARVAFDQDSCLLLGSGGHRSLDEQPRERQARWPGRGLDRQGGPVLLFSIRQSSGCAQQVAQVGPELGPAGLAFDALSQQRLRTFKVALQAQDEAEQMQGVGMAGLGGQDRAAFPLDGGQVTPAVGGRGTGKLILEGHAPTLALAEGLGRWRRRLPPFWRCDGV
jgi:hypothetical protein